LSNGIFVFGFGSSESSVLAYSVAAGLSATDWYIISLVEIETTIFVIDFW